MADRESEAPRKMKFTPRIAPRKTQRSVKAKRETPEEDALNEELLKRVKENFVRSRPKIEKKLGVEQVASFGPTVARNNARSFGTTSDLSSSKHRHDLIADGGTKMEKEYIEPWDYYSYYPTVLPLRRPHSGNPEFLNEQEFGEASKNAYDESRIILAEELGLMEDGKHHPEMLFFQLPASLPMLKRPASAKSKEAQNGEKSCTAGSISTKGCRVGDLRAGFMGKIFVYKSGGIKMKLGDTLFNVSPGEQCLFAQDVAAVNHLEKHCCILGELIKHAIVTPDVDSLVNGIANLE